MTPPVCPSFDYVSRAPYIVSHEWPDRDECWACPTVFHAFVRFFHPYGDSDFTDGPGAPDGRLMVDSRGAHVLGRRRDLDTIDCFVMTAEMYVVMERLAPQHAETFFHLEMNVRDLNVQRDFTWR